MGPYEVLSRLPGATVTFVATEPGPKRTDTGFLSLVADAALPDVPQPGADVAAGIEDDPQPPFDAGSEAKAPERVSSFFRENSRFVLEG